LRAGSINREQWEQNRRELERRAIEESHASDGAKPAQVFTERSPVLALALAILVPVIAIPLYIALGEPRAITAKGAAAVEEAEGHAIQPAQIEAMADKLAERLKAAPDDAEGWMMLARTYGYLGRNAEALAAIEKAIKLRPDDAALLADYADLFAMTRGGGKLDGEPEKIIQRALKLDPNQPKALALAGTIAFNRKDFATAARHWERAVSVLPPDSAFGRQIASGLAEAREAMGQTAGQKGTAVASAAPKAAKESAAAPAKAAAKGGGAVSGTVTLAPALAKRAAPDDTLFVFARSPQGGAPLAVIRAKAAELPLKFTLDDSMSMGGDAKISTTPALIVTARVTKSGNVVPQSGDLEGMSAQIAPGATGVVVRIDKAR